MVLRKPYRFLIQHFKIIHLILFVLSAYLVSKTSDVISFYNDFLNSNQTTVGYGTSELYFNTFVTIFPLVIMFMLLIIFLLMKLKSKRSFIYALNMLFYFFITIMLFYNKSIISSLEDRVLDIRTIKLASDLTLIIFVLQITTAIFFLVRGLGFNVKKFDFGKDMEFDVSERDNEEFEFDISIDRNKIKRKTIKNLRDLKYFYFENKFKANIVIASILLFLIGYSIISITIIHKTYKENRFITTNSFMYSVTNTFVTNKDYRGNSLIDDYLVITKIKIRNYGQAKHKLETSRFQLQIGKTLYNSTDKYKNELIDLGNLYTNQLLTPDFNEYLLIFEIPKKKIKSKIKLKYLDLNDKNYRVKLNKKFIDEKEKNIEIKTGEKIIINNNIYSGLELNISEYEINDKIKHQYNFCESRNKCYKSYEYVTPNLNTNYRKIILKLVSDNSKIKALIEKHGVIEYTLNNENNKTKVSLTNIKPNKEGNKDYYYFEIPYEIKKAEKINLIFKIRNNKYTYILK